MTKIKENALYAIVCVVIAVILSIAAFEIGTMIGQAQVNSDKNHPVEEK